MRVRAVGEDEGWVVRVRVVRVVVRVMMRMNNSRGLRGGGERVGTVLFRVILVEFGTWDRDGHGESNDALDPSVLTPALVQHERHFKADVYDFTKHRFQPDAIATYVWKNGG